jgi:OPT family oligopeptide transporter
MSTTAPASPLPVRREATARALVTGCVIGGLLAAGNVYTGLKTGFVDTGGITAALIAFMVFSGARRLGGSPLGLLENNIVQTTAASAAIMGFVVGLAGPVPALAFFNITMPGWAIAVWGLAAGVLGIAAAVVLRRKLIVDDALPFPTGRATGEVLQTIHAARDTAIRRALFLSATAAVAAAVTWLRDGPAHLIPQATPFGGAIAGTAIASLTMGISWSPLLACTGAMIGPRAGGSFLLGGGIAWVVLAPWLLHAGIVAEVDFGAMTKWIVWPALGLLVAGSFVPLLLDAGALRRSLRDLRRLARGAAAPSDPRSPIERSSRSPALAFLAVASVLTLLVVGRAVFGIAPASTIVVVVLALLLTNVSARATGETDVAPVGAVGMVTQGAFTGAGLVTSLLTGGVSTGTSSQACGMLYSLRTGEGVGASTRPQIAAQLLGAAVGAIVVVPSYLLIVKSYGLRTEALPAAGAQSWKAMAEAVQGGALPAHAGLAAALGLAVGAVLAMAARTRIGRFVPSPAAMGMAMLVPGSYAVSIFIGAVVVTIVRRARPDLAESAVMTVAAGGMAGESIAGVIVAAASALAAL